MNIFYLFKRHKHIIKARQYYDYAAFQHMRFFLSYYPDPFPNPLLDNTDSFNCSSIVRDELREFVTPKHTYEEDLMWEKSHGPQTYKGGLYEFVVEPGITKIGNEAFAYNLNLSSIELPISLEVIGKNAFTMCKSLKNIKLLENIKIIGNGAFSHELERLTILACEPPYISDLGLNYKCKILVPQETVYKYLKSRMWKKYQEQIFAL